MHRQEKSDVVAHLRFQNILTFIKEVGEMGNPKDFYAKKRFNYYMGLLLSHNVNYSHLNSIILVCKILKIQYNLA